MTTIKFQYAVGFTVARLVAPILRVTGLRFSKAWRGQWLVNHVEANMRADGFAIAPIKFV